MIRGREDAFRVAWRTLGALLVSLERPALGGTLLQNRHEPNVFYSLGPWSSVDDVDTMRRDPAVQEAFQGVLDCCHEAEPGTYTCVENVSA